MNQGNYVPGSPYHSRVAQQREDGTGLMQRVNMASAPTGWQPAVPNNLTGCFLLLPARPGGESLAVDFDIVPSINRQRPVKQYALDTFRKVVGGSQHQQFIT